MSKILVLSSIIILIFSSAVFSQQYFHAVFPGDTVILSINNPAGTIQWEDTDDTVSGAWMPIPGAVGNGYEYIVPSVTGEFFIRAEINNPAVCDHQYYGTVLKLRGITATSQLHIGDYYAGGLVFQNSGGSGYIVSHQDILLTEWGCYGYSVSALSPSFGSGSINTMIIVSNSCAGAAMACDTLTINGYSDWFLPSSDELDSIYLNLHLNGQGNFSAGADPYWTSMEYDLNEAYIQYFGTGLKISRFKNAPALVRAVRKFYTAPTVQQRLNAGELPKEIYDSGVAMDSLYGKIFQGGLIFHFDPNSGFCYMASPSDIGMSEWGCAGDFVYNIQSVFSTGEYNTQLIMNSCATPLIAARLCDDYSVGMYSDWFLPSLAELDTMYVNLHLNGLGGFSPVTYWSSSQWSFQNGYCMDFTNGSMLGIDKSTQFSIRPVRCFIPQLFAGGSGTEPDPWLISNVEELNNVRYFKGQSHHNKWFRQIANINLNVAPHNQGEGWEPIGNWNDNQYFAGHYNGSGFEISGLYINRNDWDQALFCWTVGATIDSVRVINVNVTGDEEAGGLVAWADSSHFSECYGTGTVMGTGVIGGLFGLIDNNSTITNCHFDGNIITTSYQGGGLAGKIRYTNVHNCYTTGTIFSSGSSDAGGLIGNTSRSGVTDCYSTCSVQVTGGGNVFNGGLIGMIDDSTYVANCFSTGNVEGYYHTAGFIGYVARNSLIIDCFCTGTVTTTEDWNGGFVSWNEGVIQNCYSTGSVTGNHEIGGFVGVNYSQGIIENCYCTGNVSGNDKIGGFVGHNQSGVRIKYCYSKGTVTGNTNKGGFCGYNPAMTISNCFWDTEKSGIATSAGGKGVPTYLMVRQNNYVGWPMGSIWSINETASYPFHGWQGGMQTHNNPGTFNQNYVLDYDYNLYPTVQIGTQTWMAANLKTKHYYDGNYIPEVTDSPTWASLSTPARCWYNNDSTSNDVPYGQLYNYYVIQLSNVCPTGWHVPDNTEWDLLLTTVGGASIASPELREIGTLHWINGNPGATNSTGFSAVGSGCRWYFDGSFSLKGTLSRYHSSTVFDTSNTYNYLITDEDPAVTTETNDKKMGNPIRCIKD